MNAELVNQYGESEKHYSEARHYLPGGVSSNFRLGGDPFPLCFARAEGSALIDADGNRYVDYALGMGPVILGHANHDVNDAVRKSLALGQLFAGQHVLELCLARAMCRIVPCADMVRFSMSGSEAIQAAIRVARAKTGRRGIVKFEGHYHGWMDNIFVSVQPEDVVSRPFPEPVPMSPGQDAGAYAETMVLPWNDRDAFVQATEQRGESIAAVIMEPILCNTSVVVPNPGYLEAVREICTRRGIVLIFDEVITGFRVALGGAQQMLGVTPDLAVFAKAMANGYPISCLCGRRDIMELFDAGRVMHGGTYNSNVVSCAAALATLNVLERNGGEAYGSIRQIGQALIEGLRSLAAAAGLPLLVQGMPAAFHTSFTDQIRITNYRSYRRCRLDLATRFADALMEHGVRITRRGVWFLSAAHTARDVDVTLAAAQEAMRNLA